MYVLLFHQVYRTRLCDNTYLLVCLLACEQNILKLLLESLLMAGSERGLILKWKFQVRIKAPFIATQCNSTRRRAELSCVAKWGLRLWNAFTKVRALSISAMIDLKSWMLCLNAGFWLKDC